MDATRLLVLPRQSAWSGSNNITGHFGDGDITKPGKHADHSISHGQSVDAVQPVSHSARQLHPTQDYSVPGHIPVHQTATEPYVGPSLKRSIKQTTKQAAKLVPDTPSQATPPRVDIVSSAQPAQRTKTGFQPNSQYPPSYIGMPANTTGITIRQPEERK